ncbi:MAG TPA: D-aminoacyl-tRNA deacylase [Bacteroidales bacterium]|nr:D-tyrosyl-tRNA(Tyr) deacylase [Bacteroidales bacterium]HQK36897.1 D-aminoacyl-tRNA deacylase [Bacteroidales bacterium]
MRAVIQRTTFSEVTIDRLEKKSMGSGLMILVGIEESDALDDIDWLCGKISRLRIFDDANGVMNLSVQDVRGEILVISQFTLHASTRKGNRPSYSRAAKPETAEPLFLQFVNTLREVSGCRVESGKFGAYMQVHIVNDGPVTIIIDTKNKE